MAAEDLVTVRPDNLAREIVERAINAEVRVAMAEKHAYSAAELRPITHEEILAEIVAKVAQ